MGPHGASWPPWAPARARARAPSPTGPRVLQTTHFQKSTFFQKTRFWVKNGGKKVEIEGAGLSRRDPRRNSVSGGGVDVENGGMATHLVPNWGALGSVGLPAPA